MKDKTALHVMMISSYAKMVYRLSCDKFQTLLSCVYRWGGAIHADYWHSFILDISCVKFLHAESYDMEDSM